MRRTTIILALGAALTGLCGSAAAEPGQAPREPNDALNDPNGVLNRSQLMTLADLAADQSNNPKKAPPTEKFSGRRFLIYQSVSSLKGGKADRVIESG